MVWRHRTVVGGRLVEPAGFLNLKRSVFVLALFAFLYVTNRAVPSGRRTDFMLWSLEDISASNRVRIHAAAMTIDCPFRNEFVGSLCKVLRDQLAHKQPPVWDKDDKPYMVHRFICWSLLLASLVKFCWNNSTRTKASRLSRNVLVDASLDFVLLPFHKMLESIALLAFVLYPTWIRMHDVFILQHKTSLFRHWQCLVAAHYQYLYLQVLSAGPTCAGARSCARCCHGWLLSRILCK